MTRKPTSDEDSEIKVESWPKVCGCGQHISEEDWERLYYVGVQKSGLDKFPDLEMRNCRKCGSTLAIVAPNDFV